MKIVKALNSIRSKLFFLLLIPAIATMYACNAGEETPSPGTEGEDAVAVLDCPDLEENPATTGGAPLGPPPALPNIFTGTAYVNGEPAPEGTELYLKLVVSRSRSVEILDDGKFINIIHGPVSDLDQGVAFQFCLGDPDGIAVKSEETFEFVTEPFHTAEVELNFPMLPSELSSQ